MQKSIFICPKTFLSTYTYRLVNLLTQYDYATVWKTARETRKINMLKNPKTECQSDEEVLVSDNYIEENIKTLEEKKCSQMRQNRKRKINQDILETSAKIFTYLNFCPPFLLLSLYQDLFKNAKAKNIYLALISIIKQTQNGERESAILVFKKVTETLGMMNYHFIENILNDNLSWSIID